MTDVTQRRALYVAGAWNVIGGAGALLDPAGHLAQAYTGALSLQDPVPAFFFRCVWINVVAWGLAYLLAARRPEGRAPVLLAGGAGKLAYAAACVALVIGGAGKPLLLLAALADVVFAGLFAAIVWRGRAARTVGKQELRASDRGRQPRL